MRYKTFAAMNIAIIGASEIAESYALAFAGAGYEVFMAWKDNDRKCIHPLLSTLDGINFCSIEAAADVADMIIIATSPIDVREVAYWLGDVRNKVIIDATSNVFAGADEQVRTVCAIKAITGSIHVVKAFHTKGYEQLLKPLFKGEEVEMLLLGDCKKAKEVTKILTRELGIKNWYDFGGSESIPLFNAMTTCWRELAKDQRIITKKKDIVKHG
jgi:predicted dinucleotide-binding enzyme